MCEITCPSGLKLEVRGLKGRELQLFQDKAIQRSGTVIDKILAACVLGVLDPGPYTIQGGELPKWDEVLLGDKFYSVLQIRIATYGDDLEFKTQCAECRERFPWALKLSDLPVKKLAEKDYEAFTGNHPLTTHIPSDGREVKFRLATGKDEHLAAKAKGAENALMKLMVLRIIELDGEKERHKIQAFLDDCSLADLMKLLKEFDKRDCGVETSFEVECPECQARKVVPLPLGQGFLLPN
jgi:hypothetical protein